MGGTLFGDSGLGRLAGRVPSSLRSRVPDRLRRQLNVLSERNRQQTIDSFHRLYYETERRQTWQNTSFLGVPVWKTTADLWVYQEMVFELRPDLIIETGTSFGGSALWFATICDLVGNGRVVSIDIARRPDSVPPEHPRITYVLGSSVSDEVVEQVGQMAEGVGTTLVVLDSDHSRDHVLQEMRRYGPMVSPGSYLVVEDTNVNGHPVKPNFGPGPMEAVESFLATSDGFEVDPDREKFLLTFNPRGFLRRRA